MPDPTRKSAYASIRVFDRGHGDPICVDHGLGWYSILSKDFEQGTSSVSGLGLSYLQCFPEVGLIHRAYLVPQNTRRSLWSFSGGTWEEIQLETGRGVYRLAQIDGSPTLHSWAATSTFHRPLNAPVALSLILPDPADAWDYATYEPFIRVELNAEWGVQFSKEQGTHLMRYVGGAWRAVKDLPTPSAGTGLADEKEVLLYARVKRGQLGISFDRGKSYDWYAPPGGEPVILKAGSITVRGRGSTVTFGVHQLRFYAATFDSYLKELERPRTSWVADFTKSRYDDPLGTGGSIVFGDIGNPLGRRAGYRITMTPGTQGTLPFVWYHDGAVYATHYRVPPIVQTTGDDYTTPFDDTLYQVSVSLPYALDGGNASFTFYADSWDENEWEGYRWRRMEVRMGWRLSDNTLEDYLVFVGFAEVKAVAWDELGKVKVTFALHNASARLKRRPWTPFLQLPLAGLTPNEAADEILEAFGLNSSYRSWHAWGSVGTIPPGSPEEPNELTNPNEYPWDTLKRIFAERGLELGVADNGTFYTHPKDTTTGELVRTLRAGPGAENVWEQLRGINYRTDYKECATAALVYGVNEFGQMVFGYDVDHEAETDATSLRFCPWSEVQMQELSGTPDAGLVVGHCQDLAAESFRIRNEGDTSIPLDPTLHRRQELEFMGFGGIGVPDETRFVIVAKQLSWECNKGQTALATQMGIRRLDS